MEGQRLENVFTSGEKTKLSVNQLYMSYTNHLNSAVDLVTLRKDTTAGFIKMSLERSFQATQFVEQGRALKAATAHIPDVSTLLIDTALHPAILTAAGVSDKAKQYFLEADRQLAMSEFAKNYLETAGDKFGEELIFRYLLTRGETLGGTMKNIVGYLAEIRLFRAVITLRPLNWTTLLDNEVVS